MRYLVLACDYDGTIATHGRVDADTAAALRRLRGSGRRLVLVTGRELEDLNRVCPDLSLFDRVVAENGAVIHDPATRESRDLASAPPKSFIMELGRRGVAPLSIGHAIVATWHPHETVVLDSIRDLGLELQVIFNKGAVMVLPSGINKATGLVTVLRELGLSLHNTVGIGDAENDHAFLNTCECSAAVANALPSLRERVDIVTERDHGAGVVELIDRILATDLVELEPALTRHEILLGHSEAGREVHLKPHAEAVLIAGPSGSGKSTIATWILECLETAKYQFCVVDPEGDYQDLEHAIALRGGDAKALAEEALQVLANPEQNLVLNLVDLGLDDRPAFFQRFLPVVQEYRLRTCRPHWLLVDEAHHLLPSEWQGAKEILPASLGSVLMLTVHPEHLSPAARALLQTLIALGKDVNAVARTFAGFQPELLTAAPSMPERPGRWACLFRPGSSPSWFRVMEPRRDRQRHRRKYAEGELGIDKSFYFRGADHRLNLRAQNLAVFTQLADGVDDETWLYHLRRGEYSGWFLESIGDETLAAAAAAVEQDPALSARQSRERIRQAIDARYKSPA